MATTVEISEGKVMGKEQRTPSGKLFYGYHGIPYAEPPTGSLRFKNPIPAHKWKGVKDATDENSIGFAQINLMTNTFIGTEILTLNVYSPKLPKTERSSFPVMVFFHGGGFVFGLSGKDVFGPDYLIEKDIVVVTVQYRLGVFGFLCLDIPEAPGNAGLKDQVMALKWIQRNIHVFNGDSSNVTIFGTSAGSASVEYHIVSPMSTNLFHKAIGQSGSCLNPWALNINPKQSAIELAKILGKETSDEKHLLQFFVSLATEELARGTNEMINNKAYEVLGGLNFVFVPTIEKKHHNVSSFLLDNPLEILKSGRQNNVPFITGICNKEGLSFRLFRPYKFNILSRDKLLTPFLPYDVKDESFKNYINNFYSKHKSIEETCCNFFGDLNNVAGIMLSAKFQSNANSNIYLYNFKYDGRLNSSKNMENIHEPGAMHADQEGYICLNGIASPNEVTQSDILVRERLVQMWTNFAKMGKPTSSQITNEVQINWQPIRNKRVLCLNIDTDLTLEDITQDERTALWERIYEYKQL